MIGFDQFKIEQDKGNSVEEKWYESNVMETIKSWIKIQDFSYKG
ncbi:hypothetical protein [Virgibacillus ainsalahensis]